MQLYTINFYGKQMCLNMFEVFRNVEFRISEIMVFYSILQLLTSYEIV